MERQNVSPQSPGERQRSTSPAAPASARSPSSSSYPRGQSGSTAHTTSSGSAEEQQHGTHHGKGAMQPLAHEAAGKGPSRVSSQQLQQRDSARAGGNARQAGGGSRSVAAGAPAATSSLFDTTVLTSSSSTPSGEAGRAMAHLLDSVASSTSPTSSFTPPQAAAWQSPEAATTREQRRRPSPQQLASSEAETASARRLRKKVQMEEGGFSDILGESPVWTHTPPPPTQQQRQQPSFHQQPTHVHHSPPRRSSPPPASAAAAAYRPINMDAESGTPNSDNAGDTSSMFDASSVYSRDDQRFAAATHSFTSAHGSSNWASPTEVLQLRAIFQEVTARYQREQTRLQAELAKAQAECSAYADERSRVQQLQKAYTEGLAQCAQAKQHEARWTEERALQQLQLEKMMVENQRLQLFIAKRQKLHASGHGSSTFFVPTESQERVLAAVQGVTAAVSASAATASSKGQRETPSCSPVPYPSGAAAVGMLHRAASPQHLSAAQQPTHHDSSVGHSRTTPSPARHSGAAAFQGSPFTFVSSETTPTPPPPQQRQQQDRAPPQAETGNSGSTGEADHTQLPGRSARANGGAAAELSPSTNETASSLSLSPTPLHQPPLPSQGPASQPDGERGAPQRTAPRGRDEEGEEEVNGAAVGDAPRRRRSSSMLTPSPSASEVTSATGGSRRAGLFATGTTTAAGGGAGTGTDGQDHSQAFLSYSGQSEGEVEGHDTNDDPSYARGVNDISSSTSRGSHLSASAALAMGGLLDAQGRLQQRSTQAAVEMSSSPLITSGSLVGGHLASTAATRDGARATTTAAPPPPTNATRTPVNVAGATTTATTTTTTTTPSLTDSTAAALQNKLRAASSSSSASTWSLQYLYQLPRTPAEALEEEVRMIKEIHRLTEENAAVTARWEHALALKDMDADQREHQLLRLAQEHEQARRTAAQWELTARQLQTEVASMAAQLDDARDALASVLDVSRQQQAQAQARLAAAEAQSRSALTAAREETMVKWAVLRRSFLDLMHQQKQEEGCSSSSSMRSGEVEAEAAQKATEELRTELHRARAAQVALEDQQHAMMSESRARITHLENALVRTVDTLEAVKADRSCAVQRIDELEAEVERLREAAAAREACMQTMEERLRLATGELTLQQEQLAEASLWQARAVSTEEDLATQRAFYEKEINVYKTAACAMQDGHHREIEKVVRRYEKLVVRFEAMKMQLVTALSDGVARSGALTGTARSKRSAPNSAQNSPNAAATTEKGNGAARDEAFIFSETATANQTAKLACDSVATLRSSVEATDRVARSLNRAAAALPRS